MGFVDEIMSQRSLNTDCFVDISSIPIQPTVYDDFFDDVYECFGIRLTNAQREAIICNHENLLIEAGAGSGKTTTLIVKLKFLIDVLNVIPEKILMVTFTNDAKDTMKERARSLLPHSGGKVHISTFHSLFGTILNKFYSMDIYKNLLTPSDQDRLLKKAIKDMNSSIPVELDDLKLKITSWKNEGYRPDQLSPKDDFGIIYAQYEYLKGENIDYDDIQLMFLDKLYEDFAFSLHVSDMFQYIIIDEYQDTNKILSIIMDHFMSDSNYIQVVGDPRQAIYGFRGSNVSFIKDFCSIYNARKIALNINFRSNEAIVQLANNLMRKSDIVAEPMISVKRAKHYPIFRSFEDEFKEIDFVIKCILDLKNEGHSLDEISVLMRVHFYGEYLLDQLKTYDIEHRVSQNIQSIYYRSAIKGLLGVGKLMIDPYDYKAFRDFSNWFYISNVQAKELKDLNGEIIPSLLKIDYKYNKESVERFVYIVNKAKHETDSPFSFFTYLCKNFLFPFWGNKGVQGQTLRDDAELLINKCKSHSFDSFEDLFSFVDKYHEELQESKKSKNGVCVSTTHGSKGLEWDTVFFIGHIDGIIPSKKATDMREELNLEYVGSTRPRERLFITSPEYHAYSETNELSSYVHDMGLKHVPNRYSKF